MMILWSNLVPSLGSYLKTDINNETLKQFVHMKQLGKPFWHLVCRIICDIVLFAFSNYSLFLKNNRKRSKE